MKTTSIALALISILAGLSASIHAGTTLPSSKDFTVINNDPNQDAKRPSLAVGPDGRPVIAWVEKTQGTYRGFVKRWNGQGWSKLGQTLNLNPDWNVYDLDLTLTLEGDPVVAWTERSRVSIGKSAGPGRIFVARWDETSARWKRYGSSPSIKLNSAPDSPKVRLDSHEYPALSWNELAPDFNGNSVFMDRWDGKTWQNIDPGALSSDTSSASRSRDMAVTSQDQVMLAWVVQIYQPGYGPLDFNVFVGPWDGKGWSKLGPGNASLNNDIGRYAGLPSMQLDALDRPVVAFKHAKRGFDIFVKRWDGSNWQAIGSSVNDSSGGGDQPALALNAQGTPTVTWLENIKANNVLVKRWDGQRWAKLGGNLNANPKAYSENPVIALDPQGQPTVAWNEETPNKTNLVLLRKWQGSSWKAFGQ